MFYPDLSRAEIFLDIYIFFIFVQYHIMLFGTGGFIYDPHERKVSLRMASFVAADSGDLQTISAVPLHLIVCGLRVRQILFSSDS